MERLPNFDQLVWDKNVRWNKNNYPPTKPILISSWNLKHFLGLILILNKCQICMYACLFMLCYQGKFLPQWLIIMLICIENEWLVPLNKTFIRRGLENMLSLFFKFSARARIKLMFKGTKRSFCWPCNHFTRRK